MSKEKKFKSGDGVFHAEFYMRAVIFDLDGTLIDSARDLGSALNRVLAAQGLETLSYDAVQGMIGDGAKVLVERGFAARGRVARPEDLDAFMADYDANAVVDTVVYPGIEAALAALRDAGHKLAVCTNKRESSSRLILSELGLEPYFNAVIGGDSTPYRKPDPRHLAGAVTALGAAEAVMVGDHVNDMTAASGLGIPSIFVSWGYGKAAGLYTATTAAELPGIVAGM